MFNDPAKRNVLLLAVCQALYISGTSLMIATAPLIGQMLASDPGWATLPLAVHHAGVTSAAIPASLIMRRIGRRAGFMSGSVVGAIGALLAVLALFEQSYVLFCAGVFIVGWFNGFAIFYRFAAADSAAPDFRPKAISLVLAGGLAAAIIGPELAKHTRELLTPVVFAGSYAALIGLYAISFCLLAFVRIPGLTAEERRDTGRPLSVILRQPACIVAMLSGMIGYGSMSLVMTPTPLAMQFCGFSFNESASVIQIHILGMFAPAFFTGHLVAKFGAERIILAGILLIVACAVVALGGIAFENFAVALFLNGIGWNFMFVGGTSLLTEVHTPSERAKVQGVNDFLVFGTIATASLLSGHIFSDFGWDWLNFGILPMLALALIATAFLALSKRRVAA